MSSPTDELLRILAECKAFLTGHFRLTSGLHSGHYLQCAQLFRHPFQAEELARRLVRDLTAGGVSFDTVASPALGGVLWGYEVARQAGRTNIFAERDTNGTMGFRRGFDVLPGERLLVVEDVVTTGGSAAEVTRLAREAGAEVVAIGCVANRGRVENPFDVPLFSLLRLDFPTYDPADCPLCRQGLPVEKPGSRR